MFTKHDNQETAKNRYVRTGELRKVDARVTPTGREEGKGKRFGYLYMLFTRPATCLDIQETGPRGRFLELTSCNC